MGHAGIIPAERALHMAIGTAAQFELLLRQKDIIGEWAPAAELTTKNKAIATVYGAEIWTGYFRWERIPGWRWRMKTSKSKYRAAADFDLQKYSLLFPLLEQVPHHLRSGAIVKAENGLPIRESSHRAWFRQIARAAGIPDEVYNMDSRAGGATEADESGASIEASQGALTHTKADTCPFRKLYPGIFVMQPSQDRNCDNGARSLDGSVQGRIFLKCQVDTRLIVIRRIVGKNSPQMHLAEDEHLVQALAAQCADQTFRIAILPRRSRRGRPVANTHGPDSGLKDMPVGSIVVAHQVGRR